MAADLAVLRVRQAAAICLEQEGQRGGRQLSRHKEPEIMTFRLRPAIVNDLATINELTKEAVAWLRTKDTNQWQRPWPSPEQHEERMLARVERQTTWIAWDGRAPVATITTERTADPVLWTELEAAEPAVYVHRLVVRRSHAGRRLGAALLTWAGYRAALDYGARWVRVDVWTTNDALHRYYEQQGFTFLHYCADPDYPSGALFQKATARIPGHENFLVEEAGQRQALTDRDRLANHRPTCNGHDRQVGHLLPAGLKI